MCLQLLTLVLLLYREATSIWGLMTRMEWSTSFEGEAKAQKEEDGQQYWWEVHKP
jgi:hypothetical protein